MSESNIEKMIPPVFDVLWLGEETQYSQKSQKILKEMSLDYLVESFESFTQKLNMTMPRVLICEMDLKSFQIKYKKLEKIHKKNPATAVLVTSVDLGVDEIELLMNEIDVFAILKREENLSVMLKKVIEDSSNRTSYHETLQKIKSQNVKLEELNMDLEKLVHDRTRGEFQENQNTLVSLKNIQSLLKFIKIISRSETIEDLMNGVRLEFKKFHGLRTPILLFFDKAAQLKGYYFQGKQFTEKQKYFDSDMSIFSSMENVELRRELSNLFGRPFGPIEVSDLSFQSQELDNVGAKVICEHSLDSRNLDDFHQFSFERWSIINMAIENILLKERSQKIAKQWAQTFNEMSDPIIIIDKNHKMTLSNGEFHKQNEKTCYQAFADRESPCLGCPIEKTFETCNAQTADIHCLGKVFRVHSYPIQLEGGGRASHIINQYVDVTKSVNLHGKVIQGEKMAAVGLLAGNIAHELNNPLTGIHSMSGLLLEDLDKETTTYKDLCEVRDAAHRCQNIIKDLLDFSSVGSDSRIQTIDLNEVISKTLPLLKMAMRTHNCNFQLEPKEVLIEINPQLLQQVIFNLVNNACQAMDEGGSLGVESKLSGDICSLHIRDTGPGVPDEIRDLIFDPFFTTKKEGEGTGLGLSMSRSVVERFGGSLKMNLQREKGTEFIIELPIIKL